MGRKRKTERGNRSFAVACLGGILIGFSSGALFILIFSAIALRTTDPTAVLLPMGLISLSISAMLCGRISCALWGHHSLIPALAGGGIYAVVIVLIGLCFPGSTLTLWLRCAGAPLIFLLALCGGAIGRRGIGKRRRHAKRH